MKTISNQIVSAVKQHVIPKLGITNEVLYNLSRRLCSKDFYGVFSADKIPQTLAGYTSFIIIVNLATENGLEVGHFVTIVGESATINYIDSYGLPCIQQNVIAFLELCKRTIRFNIRQIQSFSSRYCGLYSLLFACYFDKENNKGNDFKLMFYNDRLKRNDKLCSLYLKQMI